MSETPMRSALRDVFQYPLGNRVVRSLFLWFFGMLGYGMWIGSPYLTGIAVGGALGVFLGRLTALSSPDDQLPESDTTYEIDL